MSHHSTRRAFLKTSLKTSAAVAGTALLTDAVRARDLAQGDAELKIALVGCGGRGSGAAAQALQTEGPVKLVAMADAFSDRLEEALKNIKASAGDRVDVPEERRYTGFDAYEKAIAHADVVILATPPGFRPIHFEHAVGQGKHVFMEKPVAVDAPGVRKVLEAGRQAAAKGLKVGVGLQRHHQAAYIVHRESHPPRCRHRRHRVAAELLEFRRRLDTAAPGRADRNGVPDAQLVLLQLALR